MLTYTDRNRITSEVVLGSIPEREDAAEEKVFRTSMIKDVTGLKAAGMVIECENDWDGDLPDDEDEDGEEGDDDSDDDDTEELDDEEEDEPEESNKQQYKERGNTHHAPAGGIVIRGIQFKGGEFIPNSVLAKASEAEKAQLQQRSGGKPITPVATPEQPTEKRKAPGSQMPEELKTKLRELGMVGTFPPHDVPMGDIKVADLDQDPEELKKSAYLSWNQKTKSGRVSGQYRYHQDKIDAGSGEKFKRVEAIEPHLPKIAKELTKIMENDSLDIGNREAAAIASVIRETGLRPTDGADSIKHGHFGISSLQARHAKVKGNAVYLDFIGKEGVRNKTVIREPANVAFIQEALGSKKPKDFIFTKAHSGHAGDLLKSISTKVGGPDDIMVKDLRTLKATQTAREVVENYDGPPPPLTGNKVKDVKAIKAAILKMSGEVSKVLNNTPTQARDNYIHPEIFKQWQSTLA